MNYDCPALTTSTYFRRVVKTNLHTAYSNTVRIDVNQGFSGQNFIQTRTMTSPLGYRYIDKIDYYDGLGRPVETVLKNGSKIGEDIVHSQEYDNVGRISKIWNPVPNNGNGNFINSATVSSIASTFYNDNAAYSKTVWPRSGLA